MAMVACKECGSSISSKAEVCPHCGITTKSGKKFKRKEEIKKRSNLQAAGCLTIIISLILGFTVIGLPFALVLAAIGFIILIVGFIPVS
jgi:uncharacterized membrane protein YvbJ